MRIQPMQRIKLMTSLVSMAVLAYQTPMQAAGEVVADSTVPSVRDELIASADLLQGAQGGLQSGVQSPVQLAQASAGAPFVGTAAHPTDGSAQIVEVDGQYYLELDEAFRSDDGPDLFVVLHTQAVPESYSPDDFVNLGRLQSIEGAQRYAIPAGVDIAALKSAVIWCQQFNVTFGYATL
ncbi:MAG: DM13 domain-containing protein [Cyanobacteria bacterium P01_F01_bin.53]